MAATKEYAGITRATLDCLKQHFLSQGITPPSGDSGTAEQRGLKLSVTYVEAEQRLRFGIIEKPRFIAEDLVWTLLDSAVRGCAGEQKQPGGHTA
jgi:hypothetical protein